MRFEKDFLVAVAILAASIGFSGAAEPPKRPWTDTAELSLVATTGNSKTTNIAGSNKFVYNWTSSDLTVDAAALRAESTVRVLTNPDGTVQVSEKTSTTAENYSAGAKYRHNIREGFLWYGRAGWLRDPLAGIDNHYVAGAGLGYRIFKTDVQSLTSELGADYTKEDRAGGVSTSYAGGRGFLGYERALSATSKLTTELEILENLKDTADLRAKWVTSVTASLTKKLALKASYTVLYRKQPVEVVVAGETTGVPDAVFQFDKTDTIFAASLVVNF